MAKRHGVTRCGKGWRADKCDGATTKLLGVFATEAEANAAMVGNGGHACPIAKAVSERLPPVVLK